ncbi:MULTISPECIES: glutathione S-transferase family protein [unclassified Corallococcus]|uniref:glutathione S-transferase family protein n=1 Tax=unclassified Corallococcus TaxID=2685029 RepID=UPI001A8EBED0|nr:MULTISPECIES: glutathione S-transferase family protein [unclassified Corallococcus]MBN9682991.1 glutathione S-transferase family protein [Corallococcus sp. NCSPR001]WAS85473.1 glutathione S-transferase family protein [Corallococcus sp. NCRR]
MITISAFKWVPPFAQGVVRDLRVRWALEEAGLPYEARLIDPQVQKSADYRAQQPFGQVPVFQEDGLTLFESGAIVVHLASRSEVLFPRDEAGRARALTWVFAALNSLEIYVQQLAEIDLFVPDAQWAKLHRPDVVARLDHRLGELATWLGDREYLEDRFTAGDLMMTTVLRILRHTDMLDAHPTLKAYKERCEARPAFQRALTAQLEAFQQHERRGA